MTQGAASGAAIEVPAIRAKRTARAIGPGPRRSAHRRARMKAVSPYAVTGTMPSLPVEALGAALGHQHLVVEAVHGVVLHDRLGQRAADALRWRSGATRTSAM